MYERNLIEISNAKTLLNNVESNSNRLNLCKKSLRKKSVKFNLLIRDIFFVRPQAAEKKTVTVPYISLCAPQKRP